MTQRLNFFLLAITIIFWMAIISIVRAQESAWQEEDSQPVEIHGLVEAAAATRVAKDPAQNKDFLLSETRFRLDLSHFSERSEFFFKGDFLSDGITDDVEIDIRQAIVTLRASGWLDVRAGRQVLTWGTGDLVFLNDLFPKDFVSFFIGREDEFLKAPSNSVKLTIYSNLINADMVWTPVFEPDRFITGERLSFFDPSVPGLVGMKNLPQPIQASSPGKTFDNGELAMRLFRNLDGYELALYGYFGFTKQPLAFDPTANVPTYSSLAVYGASLRGNFLGGISNVEGACYNSRDENGGGNPNIANSELRALVAHERELLASFTLGLQYYLEWLRQYDQLIQNSPWPQFEREEFRHLITARFTYRLMQETLRLSLFSFYSPSDGDVHFRPALIRNWSDAVTISIGGNIMLGDDHTFFGQLENNSNAYVRIRYSF